MILTHHRRSPATPWIAYCPVGFVLLSVAQFGDTLYGFQVGWYLIMLALSIALFFLDRSVLTRIAFCAAVAVASSGASPRCKGYSSGLLDSHFCFNGHGPDRSLLVGLRPDWRRQVLYFYNWNGQGKRGISYAPRHPVEALKFFFSQLAMSSTFKSRTLPMALNTVSSPSE